MDFIELLRRAKHGDEGTVNQLLELYRPLLMSESVVCGVFDEDLYQELRLIVLRCARSFTV